MNKLARISATVASSLALVAGFSGIAGAASIDDSGRNSDNHISYSNKVRTHVDNDTHVSLHNDNDQHAYSGDANVHDNDDVDGVSTGSASNDNSTDATVSVSNDNNVGDSGGMGGSDWSAPDASMNDTGRDSDNTIRYTNEVNTSVKNDTNVWISNDNDQHASSGDANVRDNDDVGNVTTGDATNTNSSTFSVSVSNSN
jgi:hypothetical protein